MLSIVIIARQVKIVNGRSDVRADRWYLFRHKLKTLEKSSPSTIMRWCFEIDMPLLKIQCEEKKAKALSVFIMFFRLLSWLKTFSDLFYVTIFWGVWKYFYSRVKNKVEVFIEVLEISPPPPPPRKSLLLINR